MVSLSPATPITNKQAGSIVKLIIAGMLMQLVLVGYVFGQAYDNRVEVVDNQRAACERGKLDRGANAQGWRTAQVARTKTLAKEMDISFAEVSQLLLQDPKAGDSPDLTAARKYNAIAEGLETRARIDCTVAFPDARLFP